MDLYQLIDASQEPILRTHDWIQEAKDKGLVNPHSLHPTKETHILLADIIEKPLRKIL